MSARKLAIPAPGYWMDESTGVLRPAVEAYLRGEPLLLQQVAAIRAYLRQWIACPMWTGPEVEGLRDSIDSLTNQAQIRAWAGRATTAGIDPF